MIYQILEKLASDNSRIFKESILEEHRNNDVLKRVIDLALNPFTQFYQKKIPSYMQDEPMFSIEEAMNRLYPLQSRMVTGNAAIDHLRETLSGCNEDDAKVIERIIEKDLQCGVSVATVNKIWPGLIPTFDVMLCHKDISHIKYPAYAQCKADGARCHLYWDGSNATAFSRSGKQFELHGELNQSAQYMMEPGETFDGELLVVDSNGNVLDRKTGNGILNKANKGTISQEEASRIIFVPWDIVDQTGTIPYNERWKELSTRFELIGTVNNKFREIETRIVNNVEEAQEFFGEMIAKGQEGAVLKNIDNVWEGKRVKSCGKMKSEEEADLIVVGWEEGTGKNVGRLGNLICETADGKLRVSVGTGFSDNQRECFVPENTIGTIVTVRYNQRIKSKTDKLESLFLPRFVEFREDKDVANTIEELK